MEREMQTETIDLKKFADDVRLLADKIEVGEMACVGIVDCDFNSNGGPSCFIAPNLDGDIYDLIDEMVNALRETLKLTFDEMHPR